MTTSNAPRARRSAPSLNSFYFCTGCRMPRDLCVCGVISPLELDTRVAVVMHHVEAMRQSNTGRLVLPALPGSSVYLRGLAHAPFDASCLNDPDRRLWLLFPSEKSIELTRPLIESDERPITLVVPDGTWNHARKVGLRERLLRDCTHVALPHEKPSEYILRTPGHAHKVSTIEAIARALGIIEGPHVREELEKLFRVARDRILWSQGKLREEAVCGGLPFRERSCR
jgi:DTW domain-containing protein YfiP